MAQYRVREGMTHGAMKQHKAGDVVELSPAEAAAFADKLEPVETQPTTEHAEGTEEKKKGSKEAGKKAAEGDAK